MKKNTLKKTIPALVLLAAFVWFSFHYINAPLKKLRSEYRSSELNQVVTKDGNVIRTDYIDDDGNLQIAADVGYATQLIVRQNNSETETFLDDQGEQIIQYCGYYGILRDYDAAGNNIRVTYLDKNNIPIVMSMNYAVEERVFNESCQQISCRYLDAEGNPALSQDNGFGMRYEYDDKGRRIRITYLDETGGPLILPSGYSTLVREYYETDGPENGNVKKEFYYLPDGVPASLSLGQYGVYKEYDKNGQISLMTYLDDDGFPMVTNKGYTSVAYTYNADNSVQSTLYYDINGDLFQMSEGQYGTKNEKGQTVYLNADGTEQFNVKNFVYNDSRFVIIIAIVLVVLSAFAEKKLNWLMLTIYTGVILYFTLMYRESDESRFGVLSSYSSFFVNAEARASILKNIWLFIPLGGILSRLYPRRIILVAPILLSITIEAVQYFFGMGLCELDDVISNGLGGAVGYGMGCLAQIIRRQFHR